jgi:hypothetical protein
MDLGCSSYWDDYETFVIDYDPHKFRMYSHNRVTGEIVLHKKKPKEIDTTLATRCEE